ncbi:MAG: ExbD/TolR family protein [Thermodesulfobacteriota bacterium]
MIPAVPQRPWRRAAVVMPLASLIDIVFLLLIFFLLTSNFLAQEGLDLRLPADERAAPLVEHELEVSLDQGGRVFIAGQEVDAGRLPEILARLLAGRDNRNVVIRADKALPLEFVVRAMAAARDAGADKLLLATQPPEKPAR